MAEADQERKKRMNHAQIDILGEKITTMEELERKVAV